MFAIIQHVIFMVMLHDIVWEKAVLLLLLWGSFHIVFADYPQLGKTVMVLVLVNCLRTLRQQPFKIKNNFPLFSILMFALFYLTPTFLIPFVIFSTSPYINAWMQRRDILYQSTFFNPLHPEWPFLLPLG